MLPDDRSSDESFLVFAFRSATTFSLVCILSLTCESVRLVCSPLRLLQWSPRCPGTSDRGFKQAEVRGEMLGSSFGRLVSDGEPWWAPDIIRNGNSAVACTLVPSVDCGSVSDPQDTLPLRASFRASLRSTFRRIRRTKLRSIQLTNGYDQALSRLPL
jgi:hypothetical protein